MEAIRCTINYLPKDLQKAYMIHYKHNHPLKRWLVPALSALLILLGVFLLFITKSRESVNDRSWFIVACFFIVYALIFLVYYVRKMKMLGRTMFNKMPEFKNSFDYTFSADGIVSKSKDFVSSDVKWSYYQEAIIDKDIVLLFPNKFRFNFYHKRYFSEEEFKQLKTWTQDNIPVIKYN